MRTFFRVSLAVLLSILLTEPLFAEGPNYFQSFKSRYRVAPAVKLTPTCAVMNAAIPAVLQRVLPDVLCCDEIARERVSCLRRSVDMLDAANAVMEDDLSRMDELYWDVATRCRFGAGYGPPSEPRPALPETGTDDELIALLIGAVNWNLETYKGRSRSFGRHMTGITREVENLICPTPDTSGTGTGGSTAGGSTGGG